MMIKVAYIIPTLSLGGAEKQQINIVNALDEKRFQIKLYVLKNQKKLLPLVKDSQNVDVEICSIDSFFEIGAFMKFLKDIKKFNPDITHTQMYNANMLARFLKIILPKSKFINHYHGMALRFDGMLMTKPKIYLDRITSFAVDKIIVVSQESFEARLVREQYPEEKMIVLHNSVMMNPATESSLREKGEKEWVIGMASRLIPLKNIQAAMYMMAELIKKDFDIKLQVAGEGPEKENLLQYASELGISEKVDFLGLVIDMESFYKQIDIYCISSTTEDLPLSIVEAMMSGKPVLASNVGGIPGIVRDVPCTLLIDDFRDPVEINKIAEFLHALEMDKCQKHLVDYAMNNFDNQAYCSRLEQMYDDLLENV